MDEVYVVDTDNSVGAKLRLPASFRLTAPIVDQIEAAIAKINQDESLVARVNEILVAYSGDSLDASTIDREGYKFNQSKNLANYRRALKPYTGIFYPNEAGGGGMSNFG